MQKITISKALKLKNKLANEIKLIGERISSNNSYELTNPPSYKMDDLVAKYKQKVDELIDLKCRLAIINTGNIGRITKLAELKSFITVYRNMSTTKGVMVQYGSSTSLTFGVIIDIVEKDKRIADLQTEIDNLQDEIDHYNATNFI